MTLLEQRGAPMDELVARALDMAKMKGAEYADVRVVQTDQERY